MGRKGLGNVARNFNKFTRCRVQVARRARVPKFVLARLVARPVTPSKRHTFVSIMEERRGGEGEGDYTRRGNDNNEANSRYLATDDRLDDGRLEFVRLFRTLLLPPFLEKTTLDAARIQN